MRDFIICRLYSSSNIIRIIKQRRVRWAGDVAHMVTKICRFSVILLGSFQFWLTPDENREVTRRRTFVGEENAFAEVVQKIDIHILRPYILSVRVIA
jgi:hypothetical protein